MLSYDCLQPIVNDLRGSLQMSFNRHIERRRLILIRYQRQFPLLPLFGETSSFKHSVNGWTKQFGIVLTITNGALFIIPSRHGTRIFGILDLGLTD